MNTNFGVIQPLISLIIILAICALILFLSVGSLRRDLLKAAYIITPIIVICIIFYYVLSPVGLDLYSIFVAKKVPGSILQTFLDILVDLGYFILFFFFILILYRIYPAFKSELRYYTERLYIRQLVKKYRTEAETTPSVHRDILDAISEMDDYKIQITGPFGMGKTKLLRELLWMLAKKVQVHEQTKIPVLIDWDLLIQRTKKNISINRTLFADYGTLTELMLDGKAKSGQLVLLIDASILSSKSTIISIKEQSKCQTLLNSLATDFRHCSIVIAATDNLLNLSKPDTILSELTNDAIRFILSDQKDRTSEDFFKKLTLAPNLFSLARTPFLLQELKEYYYLEYKLPKDIIKLFQRTIYPNNLPTSSTDAVLSRLACYMVEKSRPYIKQKEFAKIIQQALPGTNVIRVIKIINRAKVLSISRISYQKYVQFSHPLILAFFIAFSWYKGVFPSDKSAPINFTNDPLLSKALIFFNHMEQNPIKLRRLLSTMLEKGDPISLQLVVHCILSRPIKQWPSDFLEGVIPLFIQQLLVPEMADSAWVLLENWDLETRTNFISDYLSYKDQHVGRTILEWIAKKDLDDFIYMIFHGPDSLSNQAAALLIEFNPDRTKNISILNKLYEEGTIEKRKTAIECMANFQAIEIGNWFFDILSNESIPELRCRILQNMVTVGLDPILTLLDILDSKNETDVVKIYASKLLASSASRELSLDATIYQIVRTSQINTAILPQDARININTLLERLRQESPFIVSKWEKILNPYAIGGPVTNQDIFVGREKILRELRMNIETGNHKLMIGERRIGKTSILLSLYEELKKEYAAGIPIFPVLINLEGIQVGDSTLVDETNLFKNIVNSIIDHNFLLIKEKILGQESYNGMNFGRILVQIIDLMKSLRGGSAKMIWLIDEADVLNSFPESTRSRLRSIFQKPEIKGNIIMILAGTKGLNREWKSDTSPFYNLFAPPDLIISPLLDSEAEELITKPVKGRFAFDYDAIDMIKLYSKNKPYEIQAICFEAIAAAIESGENGIGKNLILKICRQYYGVEADLYIDIDNSVHKLLDKLEGGISSKQVDQYVDDFILNLRQLLLKSAIKPKE